MNLLRKHTKILLLCSIFSACIYLSFQVGYYQARTSYPTCKDVAMKDKMVVVRSSQYADHIICTYLDVPVYRTQLPLTYKKLYRNDEQWLEKILSRHTSSM